MNLKFFGNRGFFMESLQQLKMKRIFGSIFLLLVFHSQIVFGQGKWELRICAESQSFPESSQDREGFENRIARIIADELDAAPIFVWSGVASQDMVDRYLLPGECDLIMGVADGASGLLSTVPYYRTPYVFVYRRDSGFDVQSLEDPILSSLRISTYANSIPHRVLIALGLAEDLVFYRPIAQPRGPDRDTPILEAVANGEVDVGVLYGPIAGYFAKHQADELKVVPVAPEIVPPTSQMFRIWTIGVRPNDEALRDRLNIALARRWDDIQAVFEEYGVPLLPLPRPTVSEASDEDILRVGAVLPMATGISSITDTVGEAARIGAITAEDLIGREAASSGRELRVLLASSPSVDTAVQAARRLVQVEGVTALIGGLGEGQAQALSEVAEELSVPFFNIGSPSLSLREMCHRFTFHVEASAGMYIDALVDWFSASGHRRWFFVYEDSEEGEALYGRAVEALSDGSLEEAGAARVARRQFVYNDIFEQIAEVEPDVVMLLLGAEDQEFFIGQYGFSGLEPPVVGYPDPVTQTRDFFFRFQQVASDAEAGYRATLWETTLQEHGAGELNDRFMSRAGEPMDPSGWAAYAAVKILYESVIAAGTTEGAELVAYLESPEAVFDVYKGTDLSFRPWDHQLSQPLYLVEIDPEAAWGVRVSERVEVARLVAELRVDDPSGLGQLGNSPEKSRCQFQQP